MVKEQISELANKQVRARESEVKAGEGQNTQMAKQSHSIHSASKCKTVVVIAECRTAGGRS